MVITRGDHQDKGHRIRRLTVLSTAFLFVLSLHTILRFPPESQRPVLPKTRPAKFCVLHPCIFDLGHNTGQDTFYYLSNPDSQVLAVEANPILVRHSQSKFKHHIDSGRLRLLSVGLSGDRTSPNLTFWINLLDDKFSSFSKKLGCRGHNPRVDQTGNETFCEAVEVPTTTCDQLIDEYGTPDYMKIDIEGLDALCIRSLSHVMPEQRPKYVSVENVSERVIEDLVTLGYKYFKVVEQAGLQVGIPKHLDGYTGPWGEEARDVERGRGWRTRSEVPTRESLPRNISLNGKTVPAWYDLHARM